MRLADAAKQSNGAKPRGCKLTPVIDDLGVEEVHEALTDPAVRTIGLHRRLLELGYSHISRQDVQHHRTNICHSCRFRFDEAGLL